MNDPTCVTPHTGMSARHQPDATMLLSLEVLTLSTLSRPKGRGDIGPMPPLTKASEGIDVNLTHLGEGLGGPNKGVTIGEVGC